MYGFGAAADVVMYIPFLRNVMGWLSGGPATYKALKDGLTKVGVTCRYIGMSAVGYRLSDVSHSPVISYTHTHTQTQTQTLTFVYLNIRMCDHRSLFLHWQGDSPIVNRAGRTPKHLYILPGGVAEVE